MYFCGVMGGVYTLGRGEHLKSRRSIERLFARGRSAMVFPLRAIYEEVERGEGEKPVQVLVSVPKRNMRRAVGRNRVKRLMREAYRLNKLGLEGLLLERGKGLNVAFVYVSKELPDYEHVRVAMVKVLETIIASL